VLGRKACREQRRYGMRPLPLVDVGSVLQHRRAIRHAQTRYQARADALQARLCTGASAARGAQSYVRNRKLVEFGALLTKSSTDWSLVHSDRLNVSAPRASTLLTHVQKSNSVNGCK